MRGYLIALAALIAVILAMIAFHSVDAARCQPGEIKVRGQCYTPTPTIPTATIDPNVTATTIPTSTAIPTPAATKTATASPTATATPVGVSNWTDLGQAITESLPPDGSGQRNCLNASSTPNWWRTVATLIPYNGQIFIGYGDYGCNWPDRVRLIAWNGSSFVSYGTINTVSSIDMRVTEDGLLVVPYTDLSVGTYPSASYVFPDGSMQILDAGFTPRPIHVFGSAYFNGWRCLSGSQYVPHNNAEDTQAVWCERPISQTDTRISWNDFIPHEDHTDWVANTYTGPVDPVGAHVLDRVYGLWVQNGYLYAGLSGQGGSRIMRTADGERWLDVTSGPSRMKRPLMDSAGNVWFGNSDSGGITSSLSRFNGSTRTIVVSSGVWDHTIGDDGQLYYLTSTGDIKNAAGQIVDKAPPSARSLAYVGGFFYVGTNDGHLLRSQ